MKLAKFTIECTIASEDYDHENVDKIIMPLLDKLGDSLEAIAEQYEEDIQRLSGISVGVTYEG